MESPLLIEVIAGVLILAAFVFGLARGLRVRRLAAQFYYRPRVDPVPFAAILQDVFPDARLSTREREQLHRYGIDGGGPPWTEWIHRQNLSRLSIISSSGESGWTGALTVHNVHETDDHISESLAHLHRRRLEAFADLHKPAHWKTNADHDSKDPGTYDRHFAENIVADSLKARAHSIAFAVHPARGTSQCIIDGRTFELGRPLQFDVQGHLEELPGTSVLTSEDFFRTDEVLFTIDHAPGSYKLSIIGGSGLDAAFGADKAHAGETAVAGVHAPVLASVGGVEFQNPAVTLGLSTLREIRLLKKKHTNLLTSVKNIGLDAAGTGIGSFAGAKAGATLGTAVAPGMGSVVGAIIGGISGAFAGRSISNKIKFSQAESARVHYEEKILAFQHRVQEVTREAMNALDATRAKEQAVLETSGLKKIRELEALASRLEARSRTSYLLSTASMRDLFSRCEADIRGEARETDAALRKISFRENVLWPGEEAVRIFVQRKHVMKHLAELVAARAALLDPACSLGAIERTEVCLELFAAFGGHEKEIRDHFIRYRSVTTENIATLAAWPDAPLRELARTRASALRRIGGKAALLRTRTGGQLKGEVAKARRAQNRFAKELRKLGLLK